MISIVGGDLYQWDPGRFAKFQNNGITATELHFANKGDSKAVREKIVGEMARIPDYLLRTGKQLCVYAVNDGITVESCVFPVKNRERPENYIYEDDQRNYVYALTKNAEAAIAEAHKVAAELRAARDNGEFKGDRGDIASLFLVDDGNGNVTIGTKSAGSEAILTDDGNGNVKLEVV